MSLCGISSVLCLLCCLYVMNIRGKDTYIERTKAYLPAASGSKLARKKPTDSCDGNGFVIDFQD